ncbi:MAG: type II toxin-antitoxin system Phd/YefM family antitoxin [Saprospiraceae bacterium]|jgi:antitoxin YefM|nr:type II toxin-antitoxin system Phd/YefM family antitoxin [Saprospiraceae bacterium]
MEVINYSILRNNLKEVLDKVSEDQETYIVNRGSSNAVIISLEEYNSWKETLRLMETESNRKRLSEAIEIDSIVAEEVVEYKKRTIKEEKTNPIGSGKKSKENKKLTGKEFVEKWRGVIKGADDSNLRESYLNNKYK